MLFRSGEIFGRARGGTVRYHEIIAAVHPDDRETVVNALAAAEPTAEMYSIEYRILRPSGEIRWVSARFRPEFVGNTPSIVRGAVVDITDLKMAEETALNLTGRLIDAQETERARIARSLHDDLSQRLALLAIHLSAPVATNEIGRAHV